MDLQNLTEKDVERLVGEFPLPEGVEDVVMNREEMAEAMAVSINTISKWITQGMPVLQQGENGKAYELQLSQCWAWRQASRRADDIRSKAVKNAQAQLRLAIVGGAAGDTIDGLEPRQKKEIYEAQMMQEQFLSHRNSLMKRDDVRELLTDLLALTRDTLEAAPDRVERIEAMPPKSVQAFADLVEELIGELRMRIEEFWDIRPEQSKPARNDLFDA